MNEKIQVGQKYRRCGGLFDGVAYFLCNSIYADYEVALIDLTDGGFWNYPVEVDNIYDISQEEFQAITDNYVFNRIPDGNIIILDTKKEK